MEVSELRNPPSPKGSVTLYSTRQHVSGNSISVHSVCVLFNALIRIVVVCTCTHFSLPHFKIKYD